MYQNTLPPSHLANKEACVITLCDVEVYVKIQCPILCVYSEDGTVVLEIVEDSAKFRQTHHVQVKQAESLGTPPVAGRWDAAVCILRRVVEP